MRLAVLAQSGSSRIGALVYRGDSKPEIELRFGHESNDRGVSIGLSIDEAEELHRLLSVKLKDAHDAAREAAL